MADEIMGPIDYVVFGFEGNNFDGSIMNELTNATSNFIIRILDIVFIMKDKDGILTEGEYEDQSRDLQEMFGTFTNDEKMPLLNEDDIQKIGEHLEPNTAAAVLVFEHLWAKNLKRAVQKAGGYVVEDGRIHPEAVQAVVKELAHSSH